MFDCELEKLDFVFKVEFGLDGEFEGGELVGRDVEFLADVVRAAALREKRKNFDLTIVEIVERRPGRVLGGQNLVELCPCHE